MKVSLRIPDPAILRGTSVLVLLIVLGLSVGSYVSHDSTAHEQQDGEPRVRELVSFPQERIPAVDWMRRNDWEEQKGSAAPFFIEGGVLFMRSDSSSTTIGSELSPDIDPVVFPEIEFSIRVDQVPPGADVTVKRKDDSAFRLFLLFDKGGFLSLTPPHTIGYVWDTTMKTGDTGRAATFGQVRYVAIGSGGEGTGEWKVIRRNVYDDYKLLFGKDRVPRIKAIGLKCDSNHTRTRAGSSVRFIRFIGPGGRQD